MTNWLDRAQHEIQDFSGLGTAETAKTGVSAVTAVPHLKKSGILGVGFVSFGSNLVEGFPEIEGDIHLQREIQETSSQTAAKTAERPLPRLSPAALADLPPENAAYPWWRVSIVGPRAMNIELEMRAAWSVSDWGRFARRHYGPDATVVVRVRPDPEPVTEEAAEGLCANLPGVSPEFAARLSTEDLEDIAAGDIPLATVQAFEQAAIAREAEAAASFDLRDSSSSVCPPIRWPKKTCCITSKLCKLPDIPR